MQVPRGFESHPIRQFPILSRLRPSRVLWRSRGLRASRVSRCLSLALDKCLRDWASQIARDHSEDFATVCASLLGDAISGALITTPPLTEAARRYLRETDCFGMIRVGGARRWFTDEPRYPGYWLARLIVGNEEINRWLFAHAALPRATQFEIKENPRGKPESKPALRAKIAQKMLVALISRRCTPEQLEAEKMLALATQYGDRQIPRRRRDRILCSGFQSCRVHLGEKL
jgi:hypothetical protein